MGMWTPKNLRDLRESLGISQEFLRSGRIERGESMPTLSRRKELVQAFAEAGYSITLIELAALCHAHFPNGSTAAEHETAIHPVVQEGPRT